MSNNSTLKVIVTGSSPAINHIITDIINRSGMDMIAVICKKDDVAVSKGDCVVLSEFILDNGFSPPQTENKPVILITGNKDAIAKPSAFGVYTAIKNADSGVEGLERFKKMLLDTLTEVKNKISTPAVTKPSPVTAQASEKANQAKPQKKLPSADKKTEVKKASVGKISVSIPPDIKERDIKLIAIGASTGGTDAIIEVVQKLPLNTPPVVIVQHMPEGFTQMYAERLNRICIMDAKEAEDGDRLREGLIILAHGAKQMRVYKDAMGYYIKSQHGEKVSGHCPSVDVLFDSVSKIAGEEALGVILTGMGRDGARGLKSMRDAGSFTIGQNKETCVVYGMPAVAYDEGGVSVQAPLDEIGDIIIQITN